MNRRQSLGGGARRNLSLKGFTLAEVLITLGIIGVVAAMTMPTLINKAKEKEFRSAYKKAYSAASQALLRMRAEGEFLDISPNISEGEGKYTYAIGENFKIMSKYFRTTKTCFENNADKCWVCDKGQAGYLYNGAPDWLGCSKSSYSFVDYSGMAWYLYSNRENAIVVDVNGNKGPNKLGQDRYGLQFAAAGFIVSEDENDIDYLYHKNADRLVPMRDFIAKDRWCPDGNCLYRTWLIE